MQIDDQSYLKYSQAQQSKLNQNIKIHCLLTECKLMLKFPCILG